MTEQPFDRGYWGPGGINIAAWDKFHCRRGCDYHEVGAPRNGNTPKGMLRRFHILPLRSTGSPRKRASRLTRYAIWPRTWLSCLVWFVR